MNLIGYVVYGWPMLKAWLLHLRRISEAAEEREKDSQGNVFMTVEELMKQDQERRAGESSLPLSYKLNRPPLQSKETHNMLLTPLS